MRTSITFRLLLFTNLLVLATVAAMAVLSGQVSGRVVEERLVGDTALRTARFLRTSGLPLSDRLMKQLRRIFGGHFAAVRASDGSVLGSSLSSTETQEFRRQFHADDRIHDVRVGGIDYRVGSGLVRRPDLAGKNREPIRFCVLMPSRELAAASQLARARMFVAAVPAVLVATVLSFVLSLTIIRPIRRLANEMNKIAVWHSDGREPGPGGSGSSDLTSRGDPREVAQLAMSFDRLLERLADAQDELIRSQRLAALGRVAASAAHELKNPLSGIKMHLRLLQDEPALVNRREDIDLLLREVDRMDLYLQELTDVASGTPDENGQELVPGRAIDRTDLSEVVSSVLRLLDGRCRHAGVTIRCDYHADPPIALAAPDRLRQVLMNLIINAIEAMPDGGRITISTQAVSPGKVRLCVADSGKGIELSPAEQVFDLFASTKGKNAGLGLYIARQLVLAQNGEIGCESSEQGATFWIDLPAGDAGGADGTQEKDTTS